RNRRRKRWQTQCAPDSSVCSAPDLRRTSWIIANPPGQTSSPGTMPRTTGPGVAEHGESDGTRGGGSGVPTRTVVTGVALARRTLAVTAIGRLAACGGDGGSGGGDGATVIVGMRSDFGSFNPVTSSGQYDLEVMNHALFTPLVQYD